MAMAKADRPRLVVGVSGASGVVYGLRVLDACRELGVESHLVMSRAAALTLAQEAGLTPAEAAARADVSHRVGDVGAAIASGSFRTLGMIVAPCSVRTMSEIATGVTSSLLSRAADVALKERRPLVLMVRETPLHLGHLRTLVKLAEMGAVIAPPMPAFYAEPAGLDAMVDQSVGRALDLFGLSWAPVRRWGEDVGPVVQGPVVQGPVVQGPVVQGPVVQGPVVQGPVVQGTIFEEKVVEGEKAAL
jgi:4-hydroxy-3-polyprenylbenzoate decarboxylase